MSETDRVPTGGETEVTIRYWASARAAAGTAADQVAVGADGESLAALTEQVLALHAAAGGGDRLRAVLSSCSVLVGEDPVGTRDHADVVVRPGGSVEFLPPFAGG